MCLSAPKSLKKTQYCLKTIKTWYPGLSWLVRGGPQQVFEIQAYDFPCHLAFRALPPSPRRDGHRCPYCPSCSNLPCKPSVQTFPSNLPIKPSFYIFPARHRANLPFKSSLQTFPSSMCLAGRSYWFMAFILVQACV